MPGPPRRSLWLRDGPVVRALTKAARDAHAPLAVFAATLLHDALVRSGHLTPADPPYDPPRARPGRPAAPSRPTRHPRPLPPRCRRCGHPLASHTSTACLPACPCTRDRALPPSPNQS